MDQPQVPLVKTNIKTPVYNLQAFPKVYEPREDTFLFLDALELEITQLFLIKPTVVAEIGSGSGVIISAVAHILGNSCIYLATDINPQACLATKSTAIKNASFVQCLNMDLLSCFKEKLFDIILFNPPYVLTEINETFGNDLNRSWAGGSNGRDITDKFLLQLPNLLSENGVCYMVILKENNPKEIVELLETIHFCSQVILDRKIPGEHLYIYKFFRSSK